MVGFNLLLKVMNCSWCHKTYLWGRLPVTPRKPFGKVQQGLCPACAQALVQEMGRRHAASETSAP